MSETVNDSAGLLDVELPPPQALAAADLLSWLALVGALVVVSWLLWRFLFSPRGLARRRLRALRRDCRARRLAPREAVLRLALALHLGLGLPRLSPRHPQPALPMTLAERWHTFMQALEAARFAPSDCDEATVQALFAEADFWLRRWP